MSQQQELDARLQALRLTEYPGLVDALCVSFRVASVDDLCTLAQASLSDLQAVAPTDVSPVQILRIHQLLKSLKSPEHVRSATAAQAPAIQEEQCQPCGKQAFAEASDIPKLAEAIQWKTVEDVRLNLRRVFKKLQMSLSAISLMTQVLEETVEAS